MTSTATIRGYYAEARKYMVGFGAFAQSLYQLDREVVTALLTNVGTLIVLRCGNVAEAQLLQRELGEFTTEDLLDLEVGQALVRMGPAKHAFNLAIPEVVFPETDFRDEIIDLSRQRYCRPRAEVEAALIRPPDPEPQRTLHATEDSARPLAVTPVRSELTPDQWRMLEYVADHPDETVTAVCKGLAFSGGRGSKVRQQLRGMGMVVEVETRLGQGNRPAVFPVPTIAGLRAVNKPLRSGRGGGVHRHFQDVVARQAGALGYQANTEYRLDEGGSVDVHLAREGMRIAVEIAIQSRPQRECQNIRKCLRAGYDRVLALFLDPQLLQDTRSSFSRDATPQDRQRVSFLEPERLAEELR